MINLFIPIKPTPKGRPRFGKSGVYTPSKTKSAENDIGWMVKAYMHKHGIQMMTGPVHMDVTFVYEGIMSVHADLDNLLKLVADALNGIAYNDDKQVYKITSEKKGGEKQGIFLKIGALNENKQSGSVMASC